MRINADQAGIPEVPGQRLLLGHLSEPVIGAFYDVYNELRFGFLESVYCRALEIEFRDRGLPHSREVLLEVVYKGRLAGGFRADFLIDDQLIVEVKTGRSLVDADRRQLLHYLRATNAQVGLLLHFGETAEFHRMVNSHRS